MKTIHDPRALEVTREIDWILNPLDTLLFGSRARGDWNEASDIDVIVIARDDGEIRPKCNEAIAAGKAKAIKLYGKRTELDLNRSQGEMRRRWETSDEDGSFSNYG